MNMKKYFGIGFSVFSLAFMSACSDSDNDNDGVKVGTLNGYELTVTNLTSNQPLSPLAVAIHNSNYTAWTIGVEPSLGLEKLAEEGSTTEFLNEAISAGVYASVSGEGAIFSGESETLEIESVKNDEMKLTIASMLINTNDAFTGAQSIDLSSLEIGDELSVLLPVYDAGTEANNELAGTIPGPADGGEGFNIARDDVNVVSRHPGVVTNIDGYDDSILDSSHRFDSPIAKLVLKRIQ